MKVNNVETLHTVRLVLRQWSEHDAEDLYEYAKNPNVGPHGGWKPHENIEESISIIKELFMTKYFCWALEERETGKVIGSIGFEEDVKRNGAFCMELGYALAEERWGKGLMTEAAREVIRYGFNTMGLEMISIYRNPANKRSGRVIDKCGFTFEGLLRKSNRIYNGEIRDIACYSMTREEFLQL